MKKENAKKGGMGFLSVLTLVLIALKLTDIITLPWVWVLSPIWISAVLLITVFGTILLAGRLKKGKW